MKVVQCFSVSFHRRSQQRSSYQCSLGVYEAAKLSFDTDSIRSWFDDLKVFNVRINTIQYRALYYMYSGFTSKVLSLSRKCLFVSTFRAFLIRFPAVFCTINDTVMSSHFHLCPSYGFYRFQSAQWWFCFVRKCGIHTLTISLCLCLLGVRFECHALWYVNISC